MQAAVLQLAFQIHHLHQKDLNNNLNNSKHKHPRSSTPLSGDAPPNPPGLLPKVVAPNPDVEVPKPVLVLPKVFYKNDLASWQMGQSTYRFAKRSYAAYIEEKLLAKQHILKTS